MKKLSLQDNINRMDGTKWINLKGSYNLEYGRERDGAGSYRLATPSVD